MHEKLVSITRAQLLEHVKVTQVLSENDDVLHAFARALHDLENAFRGGNKVLVCGNGGSAAGAQHFASELVTRFFTKGQPGLPALALTTDTSLITAVMNDEGADEVFARQIAVWATHGDVVMLLSTSGESENLIKAAECARRCGATVTGLLGKGGGQLRDLCHYAVVIPSDSTERIQEMHEVLLHIAAAYLDECLPCGE